MGSARRRRSGRDEPVGVKDLGRPAMPGVVGVSRRQDHAGVDHDPPGAHPSAMRGSSAIRLSFSSASSARSSLTRPDPSARPE